MKAAGSLGLITCLLLGATLFPGTLSVNATALEPAPAATWAGHFGTLGAPLFVYLPLIMAPDRPLPTGGVVGTITRPGFRPSALALDESRNRLFVFDEATHNIYIYNATTLAEVGSVPTSLSDCLSMVVDESHGKLYAGDFGPGVIAADRVAVIDTAGGSLLKYLPTAGGVYLVKDEVLDTVYFSSSGGAPFDGGIYKIDVATDVTERITGIWGNVYTSLAVNPLTHELFVANWSQNDNNLFIINPTTLAVTPVPDLSGFGVAMNWMENKAYITYCASAGMEGVCIYDRDTGTVTRTYTANDGTQPLVFNPNVNRLYSDTEVNAVTTIFNGAADTFTNVTLEMSLTAVGVRHLTDNVYYAGWGGTYVMKGATGAVVAHYPTAGVSCTICQSVVIVSQATGRVYVVNDSSEGAIKVVQDGQY